jgi:hypothetical protein
MLTQVWIGCASIFSYQNHFFNLNEFSVTKIIQIQYLPYLRPTIFQISFNKPCFQGLSRTTKNMPKFSYKNSFLFKWNFNENCSIFNNVFKTLWNQLGAPLLVKRLSNSTKRHCGLGISTWQTNKLPSFINSLTTFLHRLLNIRF